MLYRLAAWWQRQRIRWHSLTCVCRKCLAADRYACAHVGGRQVSRRALRRLSTARRKSPTQGVRHRLAGRG